MKKRMSARRILILLTALAATLCLWTGLRIRGSIKVKGSQDIPGPEVVCYQQADPKWAGDSLGGSRFTMKSSGCLTACIASLMEFQGTDSGIYGDVTPGTLNQYFSERQVYDSQGNIQWESLEQALGMRAVRKNAAELEASELEQLLAQGVYPILRVRIKGVGSFHYVLAVKSEKGEFWCMDPLNKKNRLVPLSDFGNRIYGIRCLIDDAE